MTIFKNKKLTSGVIAALVFFVGGANTVALVVSDPSAKQGMLMSMSANADVAEPASDKNAQSLLGILAPPEESLTLKPGDVNIKKDGVANTLVSTVDGDIKVGDRIKPSTLVGIGSKAEGPNWIVGIAQASLDSKTEGAIKSEVTDNTGAKREVYIAQIPVLVNVTYVNENSSAGEQSKNEDSIIPSSIREVANKIAGREVNTAAIVASAALIIVGLFLAAQLVNNSTRAGFAAIARQPLSKSVIVTKVTQAFVIAGVIVVATLLVAYLILRLL